MDQPPAQVYATLLDEERYLCSERTMYRILHAEGEVRERRNQLEHPPYVKPELLATGPNEVWSWDITKLKGPVKWTYFYLYVILDNLQPVHGGLDGGGARVGRAGQAVDSRELRQAGDRSGAVDAARGPRLLDAVQMRGPVTR